MSVQATKKDIEELESRFESKIDKAVDDLSNLIQMFINQVDERFNSLEVRMDEYDKKLDKLINTIDGFVARIDSYETEMAARDKQMERLLQWARKVSEKTGIPLENL